MNCNLLLLSEYGEKNQKSKKEVSISWWRLMTIVWTFLSFYWTVSRTFYFILRTWKRVGFNIIKMWKTNKIGQGHASDCNNPIRGSGKHFLMLIFGLVWLLLSDVFSFSVNFNSLIKIPFTFLNTPMVFPNSSRITMTRSFKDVAFPPSPDVRNGLCSHQNWNKLFKLEQPSFHTA